MKIMVQHQIIPMTRAFSSLLLTMKIFQKLNYIWSMLKHFQKYQMPKIYYCINFFLTNNNVDIYHGADWSKSRTCNRLLSNKVGCVFPRFLYLSSISNHNLDTPAHILVHIDPKLSIYHHISLPQKWNYLNFSNYMCQILASMLEEKKLMFDVPKSKLCKQVSENKSHCIFSNLSHYEMSPWYN